MAAITMPAMENPMAALSPMKRPSRPEIKAPPSGAKTAMAKNMRSALHQVDVLNLDRSAVTEIDDDNGETDRRLGRGDRQHQHGHHLPGQIVLRRGEGDQVEVDRQQDQLDRHQDDDDVLP